MSFPRHEDYRKPAENPPAWGVLPRYLDLAVGIDGEVLLAEESCELALTPRLFAQGLSFKTSD